MGSGARRMDRADRSLVHFDWRPVSQQSRRLSASWWSGQRPSRRCGPAHIASRRSSGTNGAKIADGMRKRWESSCLTALEAGKEPPDMPAVCEIGAEPSVSAGNDPRYDGRGVWVIYDDNPRGITLYPRRTVRLVRQSRALFERNRSSDWLESYTGGAAKIDRKSLRTHHHRTIRSLHPGRHSARTLGRHA